MLAISMQLCRLEGIAFGLRSAAVRVGPRGRRSAVGIRSNLPARKGTNGPTACQGARARFFSESRRSMLQFSRCRALRPAWRNRPPRLSFIRFSTVRSPRWRMRARSRPHSIRSRKIRRPIHQQRADQCEGELGLGRRAVAAEQRGWRRAFIALWLLHLWSGKVVADKRVTEQSIRYGPRDRGGKPAGDDAGGSASMSSPHPRRSCWG